MPISRNTPQRARPTTYSAGAVPGQDGEHYAERPAAVGADDTQPTEDSYLTHDFLPARERAGGRQVLPLLGLPLGGLPLRLGSENGFSPAGC